MTEKLSIKEAAERLGVSLVRMVLVLATMALVVSPSIVVASKEPISITVFIPSRDAITSNGKCRLNFGSQPILRFEQVEAESQQIVVTMPLRDGTRATSDNDVAPGNTGCVIERTVALDPASDYDMSIGNNKIATLEANLLAANTSPTLIITVDSASSKPSGQWVLAGQELNLASSPTPMPTPTPAPTPTSVPAGDQGDGTYLLRGYLVLYDEDAIVLSDTCHGAGGFSDIESGVQVVIRDGNNNVMGIGELVSTDKSSRGAGCSFEFEAEVEKTKFYQIEISHRTGLVYTFEDLEEYRWTIYISLGS